MLYKICGARCSMVVGNISNKQRTRNLHETHYDVLNVKRDSSHKEIKDAYIELSKRYHPDTSKCIESHKKFLKVAEAYNTLSRSESRRNYDLGLCVRRPIVETYGSNYSNPRADPTFWNNRNKTHDNYYKSKPYYGIKGVNRVSNTSIVFLCLLFTVLGAMIQAVTIRSSMTLKRNNMIEKSKKAEDTLSTIQQEAESNGNDMQLQKMIKRMEEQNLLPKNFNAHD